MATRLLRLFVQGARRTMRRFAMTMTPSKPSNPIQESVTSEQWLDKGDWTPGFLRRIVDSVFGYDYFISYTWSDGRTYALELAKQLKSHGFSCFLDSDNYKKGDRWKRVGAWTLRRTSRLVLVGSPNVYQSKPVLREVKIFARYDRQMIPISFAGSLDPLQRPSSQLLEKLGHDRLRIEEPIAALDQGPSDRVVKELHQTFKLMRQDQKRIRILLVTATLFALIAVAAAVLAVIANAERNRATRAETETQKEFGWSLLREGDLLREKGQPAEAKERYRESRERFRRAGAPTTASDIADWTLGRFSPRPLLEFAVQAFGKEAPVWKTLVKIAPDGQRVAVSAIPQQIQIWDATHGGLLDGWEFEGAEDELLSAMTWSPDSTRLATAASSGIRIWDVASGNSSVIPFEVNPDVPDLAFSPDGFPEVKALAFSPSGSYLVVDAWIWDFEREKLIKTEGHDDEITCVAFGPGDDWYVTGGLDHRVRRWKTKSGEQVSIDIPDQPWPVWAVAVSSRGDQLAFATGASVANVEIWDVEVAKRLLTLTGGSSNGICFSKDGRSLFCEFDGGKIRRWDSKTGELLAVLDSNRAFVTSISISSDGRFLASGGSGAVHIWSLLPSKDAIPLKGHTEFVADVAFLPGNRLVASGANSGELHIWDVATGRLLWRFQQELGTIERIDVSPDGQRIVTCGNAGIRLINPFSGESKELALNQFANTVTFADDQNRLLLGCRDGSVLEYAIDSGNQRSLLELPWSISSIAYSKPHDWIAVGTGRTYGEKSTIVILQFDRPRAPKTLREDGDAVYALAFSPDGQRLISAGGEVWDVETHDNFVNLRSAEIYAAAFSPDRTLIATGGPTPSVRLWQSETGREIQLDQLHQEVVNGLAWSSDGTKLITGGGRQTDSELWICDFEFPKRRQNLETRLARFWDELRGPSPSATALSALGEWYAIHGIWDRAASLLSGAQKQGGEVDALLLASVLRAAGQTAAADREIERALNSSSQDLRPYIRLLNHQHTSHTD